MEFCDLGYDIVSCIVSFLENNTDYSSLVCTSQGNCAFFDSLQERKQFFRNTDPVNSFYGKLLLSKVEKAYLKRVLKCITGSRFYYTPGVNISRVVLISAYILLKKYSKNIQIITSRDHTEYYELFTLMGIDVCCTLGNTYGSNILVSFLGSQPIKASPDRIIICDEYYKNAQFSSFTNFFHFSTQKPSSGKYFYRISQTLDISGIHYYPCVPETTISIKRENLLYDICSQKKSSYCVVFSNSKEMDHEEQKLKITGMRYGKITSGKELSLSPHKINLCTMETSFFSKKPKKQKNFVFFLHGDSNFEKIKDVIDYYSALVPRQHRFKVWCICDSLSYISFLFIPQTLLINYKRYILSEKYAILPNNYFSYRAIPEIYVNKLSKDGEEYGWYERCSRYKNSFLQYVSICDEAIEPCTLKNLRPYSVEEAKLYVACLTGDHFLVKFGFSHISVERLVATILNIKRLRNYFYTTKDIEKLLSEYNIRNQVKKKDLCITLLNVINSSRKRKIVPEEYRSYLAQCTELEFHIDTPSVRRPVYMFF